MAKDCLNGRSLKDEDREGGALCTTGLDTAVVGLGSFHRNEGKRRLSLAVRLSVEYSPDLRRLVERSRASSLSLNESSPGIHSGVLG